MSSSRKRLVIGITVGLLIGVVAGYLLAPRKVDTTQIEERITGLEAHVRTLEGQVNDKDKQIASLQSQLNERNSRIADLQSDMGRKETEISVLTKQIQLFESIFGPLRRGDWNVIANFSGTSWSTTDYFYAGEAELRINWTATSHEIEKWTELAAEYLRDFGEDSAYYLDAVDNLKRAKSNVLFGFILFKKGEAATPTEVFESHTTEGITHIHDIAKTDYYFRIVTANLDQWIVTVEVWVPG